MPILIHVLHAYMCISSVLAWVYFGYMCLFILVSIKAFNWYYLVLQYKLP